ncbi:hypothetical protein INT43_006596 [Umbelopsis isabellina]|uniref:F-box domain-containing protein n=1 Tax=Mortierella isabellina TaxID=91625 RepID=A0A8H7UHT2_MORIS|nr:hypothetical protein INT43_006596 [Umbelopsis isabellina]
MLAGETGITSDEWSFELESPYIPALELPYSVIACICKHLPTQGDRQRACLIHPIWSPAATDSLWKEPVFSNAAAFQGFYKTVHVFKRLALRVHTLNIIHDSNRNASNTIKLSSLPQHNLRESTLAKPEVVIALTRLCENVQSLKIYGWHIRAGHLERLGTALHDLKHLTIIGSNEALMSASSSFRTLLTRLATLKLDGVTNINAGFVDLLERRCQQLETLQLGVQDLGPDGFEALTLGKLLVKELILTDCSPLEDSHILELAIAFPMLESLVIIDAEKLTGEALVNVFEHCRHLRKLDIRNNSQKIASSPAKAQSGRKELKTFIKSEDLRELTIHGVNLDTITVQTTLYGHHNLHRLWLQTCHELCDDDLRLICQSSHCLEYVKVVDCPGLTGRALSTMVKSHEIKAISVQLIKCGIITTQHVKQFCQAVLGCSSKKLIISQDKGSIPPDYAGFAGELIDTQEPVYIFDKQALNSLAQSHISDGNDDGENLISQRTYTLDRKQVAMVAEHLGISSQQLRAAISKVLQNATQSKKFGKGVTAPQRISISPSEGESSPSKSNIPPTFKASEQKDATAISEPAINTKISNGWASPKVANNWPSPKPFNNWSASIGSSKNSPDVRIGAHSPDDSWLETTARKSSNVPIESEPTAAISPPPASTEQKIVFKYQPLVENSGRNVEVEDEKPAGKITVGKRSETPPKAAEPSSAIQLGGWGVSSPTWNDNFGQTAISDEGSNWDATAVERMTWQPAEIVTAPVASKSAKKKGARLYLPASSEHDGWGAPPEERVAWDDDGKQGFAHDIIQSQHQTTFWKMEGGVWKKLSAGEQREKERKDAAMEDFPMASPSGNEKSALASPPITRHILNPSSHQILDNDLPLKSSREEVDVDAHVLSDDNEDDFTDSDDGVVIKTGADDGLAPSPSRAAVLANIMDEETVLDYNESMFAELSKDPDSPPSHPGNPQWVAYEQWKKSQLQSTAIEHPEGSQAVDIPVDDGGWDDLPAATSNQPEVNGGWATEKVWDTSSPTPPIASYKLIDIIDDFNERISSLSTQSRTTSDIKWEGFESSMFSDHDNEANDQFRQLAEDKHDATVQYIKAQAESRQIAREDIIRQTENDLNSSSFTAQFESQESKFATDINADQYDANRADDDWVSSTTSEAGYNMSGLGISNKVSRRARNRESRARASARHPMRPEKMAGQWGLFPINGSNVDDSIDNPLQSPLESGHRKSDAAEILDEDERTFTHGQTKDEMHQEYDLLNTSNGSFIGSDHNDEFNYKLDTPVEPDMRRNYVSSSTADLWDEPDKLTEENLVNMDNVLSATPVLEPSGQNAHTKQYSRDFFDDLMGETANSYVAPLSAGKEAMPASTDQATTTPQSPRQQSPSPQSPSPQAATIPKGNANVTILSVKIETVDAGTQPLVIKEADDPKQAIHDFCVKYGMTEYETKIVDVTLPRYKEKMAKRVLGRAARNNNSPGQSTASPTLANNTSGSMESLL